MRRSKETTKKWFIYFLESSKERCIGWCGMRGCLWLRLLDWWEKITRLGVRKRHSVWCLALFLCFLVVKKSGFFVSSFIGDAVPPY